MNETIRRLDPAQVRVPPDRQRKELGDIEGLAESIRQHGQLNPITCRLDADGTPVLVAGERRLRACALLGRPVLARIIACDDPLEHIVIEFHENEARKQLTALERARAISAVHARFMRERGPTWTVRATARALGLSHATVADYLAIAHEERHLRELAGASIERLSKNELKRLSRRSFRARELAARGTKAALAHTERPLHERIVLVEGGLPVPEGLGSFHVAVDWATAWPAAERQHNVLRLRHAVQEREGAILLLCNADTYAELREAARAAGLTHQCPHPIIWHESRAMRPEKRTWPKNVAHFILWASMHEPAPRLCVHNLVTGPTLLAAFTSIFSYVLPQAAHVLDATCMDAGVLLAALRHGAVRAVGLTPDDATTSRLWREITKEVADAARNTTSRADARD